MTSPQHPNESQCDCKSYNGGFGKTREVVLPRPDWMSDGQRVNGVPVDACISEVIKYLWDNDIVTLSSCCGHNGRFGRPSLVLGDNVENYQEVRDLIREKDNRHFELSQWRRVLV